MVKLRYSKGCQHTVHARSTHAAVKVRVVPWFFTWLVSTLELVVFAPYTLITNILPLMSTNISFIYSVKLIQTLSFRAMLSLHLLGPP
jgi:lipopolysaccharide/colanic/teichoic acid biosynthesis glycosyltransferase